jgi:hypothetical protein
MGDVGHLLAFRLGQALVRLRRLGGLYRLDGRRVGPGPVPMLEGLVNGLGLDTKLVP